MSRFHRALVIAICTFVVPTPAWAWNSIGHMTVAKRAYDELDDGSRKRALEILQKHPHYDEFLAKDRPLDVPLGEWVFVRAATWPDWVRPRKNDSRGERVTKFHRGDDHFTNLPFIKSADAAAFAGKTLGPDPDKHDIVCALKQRAAELQSRESATEDKAVALCWFLHLVGDIHQPLHCVALYSPQFEHGDLGGNMVAVTVNGNGISLHSYWDELLGEDAHPTDDGAQHQLKLYQLAKQAAETLKAPQYARDKFSELSGDHSFAIWSQESFEAAKSTGYLNGEMTTAPFNPDKSIPDTAYKIETEYSTAASAVAQRRAALAGWRLASRLVRLLTGP